MNSTFSDTSLALKVSGDLVSTNAEIFRKEVGGLLASADGAGRKWSLFSLDLTAAKMVDSVGLNLVVALLKRVQERGAKLQIAYTNPNVLRTFVFTRLEQACGDGQSLMARPRQPGSEHGSSGLRSALPRERGFSPRVFPRQHEGNPSINFLHLWPIV
jgi:anti-anti-sigma factor